MGAVLGASHQQREDMDSEEGDPPRQDGDQEYLTMLEAAAASGFSTRMIERWMDEGRIGFIVVSGERLIMRQDFEGKIGKPRAGDAETNESNSEH